MRYARHNHDASAIMGGVHRARAQTTPTSARVMCSAHIQGICDDCAAACAVALHALLGEEVLAQKLYANTGRRLEQKRDHSPEVEDAR